MRFLINWICVCQKSHEIRERAVNCNAVGVASIPVSENALSVGTLRNTAEPVHTMNIFVSGHVNDFEDSQKECQR